jgi:mono/diheme cytochrome c family protein
MLQISDRVMMLSSLLLLCFLIGFGAARPISAQERVEQGHMLARQWCSGCHLVEPGQPAGGDAAPPFMAVAQDPALTPERLTQWLADPHPPMPNLSLANEEIAALVAYIGSLRLP